jgi:hypothetical protein
MPMPTYTMKDLILGNHLLFARAGKVIDGVTVGPEARPDTTPTTNYTKFPTVQDWSPKINRNVIKRRAPSPGRYEDRKEIVLSSSIEYAYSLQEFSELTLAELLLGGNEPVDGIFVPNERRELLTGWWISQSYDQEDDQIVALNIYGSARIDSYKFGESLDPYALIITQLYSSITTGEITNLEVT